MANPGLPLRCASGSPGANFVSSLRDAFYTLVNLAAALGRKMRVSPGGCGLSKGGRSRYGGSEGQVFGYPAVFNSLKRSAFRPIFPMSVGRARRLI